MSIVFKKPYNSNKNEKKNLKTAGTLTNWLQKQNFMYTAANFQAFLCCKSRTNGYR